MLLAGFSGTGKSNITLTLALMSFAFGDAVVYVPSCDEWKKGDETKRANFWLDCTRVTLVKHFDQAARFRPNYTWGDLLFLEDPAKAYAAIMKELHHYDGGEFAVLIFYDEQSKVADDLGSPTLSEASSFVVACLFCCTVCCPLFVMLPCLSSHCQTITSGCRIITTSGQSKSWSDPHRELGHPGMKVVIGALPDEVFGAVCRNILKRCAACLYFEVPPWCFIATMRVTGRS
jgi:hypothetical protein